MKTARKDLLGPGDAESDAGSHSTGILPSQDIEYLIRVSKEIIALEPVQPEQIQPASRAPGRVRPARKHRQSPSGKNQ